MRVRRSADDGEGQEDVSLPANEPPADIRPAQVSERIGDGSPGGTAQVRASFASLFDQKEALLLISPQRLTFIHVCVCLLALLEV